MIQPNKLNHYEQDPDEETQWDDLRAIPFAGEKNSTFQVKEEIRSKVIQILEHHKDVPLTAKEFILIVIEELQPILASRNMSDILRDYLYWNDVLGELKPIIVGFWAECDPMMIQYLYMVFVAQFMVILQLWARIDFADLCIKDCASLGEFYLDVSVIDNDMLMSIANRWNILGEGKPHFLPV